MLVLASIALIGGGFNLTLLGGSPYYIFAGFGCLVSGILIARRRIAGAWLYGAVLAATIVWAIGEVRLDFFALVPRLALPLVFGISVALCLPLFEGAPELRNARITASRSLTVALVSVFIAATVYAFIPHPIYSVGSSLLLPASEGGVGRDDLSTAVTDWRHYGRTPSGTRFAPLAQITPGNVETLEVAWTFRMGDAIRDIGDHQDTPLQIGSSLFICTQRNVVFSLDTDTGKQNWTFDPHTVNDMWPRCRGVGYYESHSAARDASLCPQRVILSTVDDQLIALDAQTGHPCQEFGDRGYVDLKVGMGEVKPGFYYPTSAPTVMRDLILIGGLVYDNVETGEPSGVIRAYSAETGALVWAWDLGNPAVTREPPKGETYTRATPNMWSTPSFDDQLGLVYVPLGVATPDFWGAGRSKEAEEYGNSLVALDIETGRPRWHFQAVHHDLWDSDLPPQPALYDMPDGKGGTVPAVIQGSKNGQIFVLDRRSGQPLATVIERPVPQGGAPDDWTSATQPFSTGMPAIGKEPLTEAGMWGITPFDQLWCRIKFRQLRYEGPYTPPTTRPGLMDMGYFGGMNWGGVSIDESRGYLIVNDIRIPIETVLVPRAEADRRLEQVKREGEAGIAQAGDYKFVDRSGMRGTPYGVDVSMFMSPVGLPCPAPPWGTLTAIDLATRRMMWQIPMGTARDARVRGIKTGLPVPIGLPTVGGPLSTQTGLVFYAGTQDYYLRALDVGTGKELWKGRLPVGSQATPMTYLSPKSGRQFVVIVAGGTEHSDDKGDFVVAYALPAPSAAN
jgi:quinate dehydrogenase (quinone)